jgi:hypothetical protein
LAAPDSLALTQVLVTLELEALEVLLLVLESLELEALVLVVL